jgi:hypothetical protein
MNSKCGLGFLTPAHHGNPDACSPFGISLLRDPTVNNGTAFALSGPLSIRHGLCNFGCGLSSQQDD